MSSSGAQRKKKGEYEKKKDGGRMRINGEQEMSSSSNFKCKQFRILLHPAEIVLEIVNQQLQPSIDPRILQHRDHLHSTLT